MKADGNNCGRGVVGERVSEFPGRPKKRGSGNSLAERKGERGKGTQSKDKIYQRRGASESKNSFHSILCP